MGKKKGSINKTTRHSIMITLVMIAFIVGIVLIYYNMLYEEKRRAIKAEGEQSARWTAQQFEEYLTESIYSVKLTAFTVNKMIDEKQDDNEIKDYLISQSLIVKELIPNGNNGFYGYINGEFFSGIGWVPPSGYNIKSRPWYIAAMANPGGIETTRVYVDKLSGDSVITFTTLLGDQTSVLAMDVELSRILEMTEEAVHSNDSDMTMILDGSGNVVAYYTKDSKDGEDNAEEGSLEALIITHLRQSPDESFEVRNGGKIYTAYAASIQNGWQCISVMDTTGDFRSIRRMLYAIIFVICIMALIISVIMAFLNRRSVLASRLSAQLSSLADIYVSVYEIDFTKNTFKELRNFKAAAEMVRGVQTNCQEILKNVMKTFSDDLSRDEVLDFIDFSRLDERLSSNDTATLEYMDNKKLWRKARYIISERTPDGSVARGMFLVEDIDEEHRTRNKLMEELEINNDRLLTISKTLLAAYEMDLEKDTFTVIKSDSKLMSDIIGSLRTNAREMLTKMVTSVVDKAYVGPLLAFVDTSTIDERFRDTNTAMMEFTTREGKWISFRIIVSRRNENGKVTSIMILTQDIDREKKERDRLIDASERAIAASQAKSSFLSNMSHEIRTPINAVLGLNEMILRECDDENIVAYSENIKTAGDTLLGLVNDILDFSKIEAGKMVIIPVSYEISSLLNDLVNMIRTRADDKGLTLALDFDSEIPRGLYGDEIRIKQVITNILTNAVKYTEKGTVTFSVTYSKIEKEPDYVMLDVAVKDTGIGIREEDIKRLFSEFERIDEKHNRNIEGTGLGMNITKGLLDMMGSALHVESTYGEGSLFYFSVKQKVEKWEPMGDYEAASRQSMIDRNKYKEKFRAPEANILVVDDNQMNLMVFTSLLKHTALKIDTAASGDEGISLTRDKKYDVIFLDHMMPEKDGIETLHEMQAQKDNPNLDTPVICLTANAIAGAREEYISQGFDDYLTKPIDSGKLEQMLIDYLPDDKIERTLVTEEAENTASPVDNIPEELAILKNEPWIDLSKGIENSGDMDAYMPVLKVFYSSLDDQAGEIERLYQNENIKDYTVKVHAIKSSARLIGAMEFGEEAQALENAGKSGDMDYIRSHHESFMAELYSFKEPLARVFDQVFEAEQTKGKPIADPELMDVFFEEINLAADDFDLERLENIFAEAEEYSIPEEDIALWNKLKDKMSKYDYEGIQKALESRK